MNQPIFHDKSEDEDTMVSTRHKYRNSIVSLANPTQKTQAYKTPSFNVKRPQNTYITVDQALQYTGDNSTYSKRILIFMSSYWIWYCMLAMGMPLFLGGKIAYYCLNPLTNEYERCSESVACDESNATPFIVMPRDTIIAEFNLVCKRSYLIAYIGSMIYLSFIVSSWRFPTIVDLKGRKNVLLACGLAASVSCILASRMYEFYAWMAFIFIAGFSFGGLETVGRVYLAEISARNFRVNSTAALNIVWAASQIILGLLLRVVHYWRHVFFYMMGLFFLCTVALGYFFFDESPKYLDDVDLQAS